MKKDEKMDLENSSVNGSTGRTRKSLNEINPNEMDKPSASSRNTKSDPPELIAIPGYTYEKELHRSKRTILYKAHEDATRREVAIKQFKYQDEFSREKEIQQRINKSSCDKGNFLLAHTFLEELKTMVVPYLHGGDLYVLPDKLVPDKLKPSQTWVLTVDLFDALQILHNLGIVHRDVKSRNVLIDITNPALEKITAAETLESYTDVSYRLFDFEFSGHSDLPDPYDEKEFIGTPRYMAPEVCFGEKYDPRSDIYSAAIILYRLLAGRYPIDGDKHLQIIQRQIREDIPDITQFNSYITPRQNAILQKGLAKKPEDRYQSAREFKHDWLDELMRK